MSVELNALRDQIDEVDQQMIKLLARRLALVEKVGEVKSQHGLPIYARNVKPQCWRHAVKKLRSKVFRLN